MEVVSGSGKGCGTGILANFPPVVRMLRGPSIHFLPVASTPNGLLLLFLISVSIVYCGLETLTHTCLGGGFKLVDFVW